MTVLIIRTTVTDIVNFRERNWSYDMTEAEAEKLLIRDLEKRYRLFSKYGKDALILTVLSYNVGHGTLLGYGKHPKSRLLKKLEAGDRDIYKEYISYCHYKGRKIRSIERRRKRSNAKGELHTNGGVSLCCLK